MTELLINLAFFVVVFVLVVFAVYVIVRVSSIAHFRSRTEYDKGEWMRWHKKREDSNG